MGIVAGRFNDFIVAPLLEVLQTREPAFGTHDFAQALGALAHLARHDDNPTTVREFLARQTGHLKPQVRRAALAALGTLGDPKAVAVVETFARGAKDSPERQAAQEALGKLRAARRPAADLGALRDEVLGFQQETRELRKELETLRQEIREVARPKPVPAEAPSREKPRKKNRGQRD